MNVDVYNTQIINTILTLIRDSNTLLSMIYSNNEFWLTLSVPVAIINNSFKHNAFKLSGYSPIEKYNTDSLMDIQFVDFAMKLPVRKLLQCWMRVVIRCSADSKPTNTSIKLKPQSP